MKRIRAADDIVPIGAFKSRASAVIRGLRAHRRPVVVTQNGKAAAVLLAPEEFDLLVERSAFVAAVGEGLSDVEAGRTLTDDELGEVLDRALGQPAK